MVTNRESLDSARLGLEVAAALQKLYPGKLSFDVDRRLIGSLATIRALGAGEDPRIIQQNLQAPLEKFIKMREKYLIYR